MAEGPRLAAIVLVLGAALSSLAHADPITLTASPIALDSDHPEHVAVGHLVYRGGLVLQSGDARFGGWSDLHVSADGTSLLALSDHSFWFTAKLGYDHGELVTAGEAQLGPLIDSAGTRLVGRRSDSEGMAVRPDGAIYISFERIHRIWLYPASNPPFSAPPRPVPTPARLVTAPDNGGIEALAWLSGGTLLALVESLYDGAENVGWVGDDVGATWQELHYRTAGRDYAPTALAELPPGASGAGDVLVLERKFTIFSGRAARITRLARGTIRPGAHLQGEEIAHLQSPLTLDNFEGISAVRAPDGTVRLYIISDDNYTFLQRTLLFMFEMK
ncbi:MAG TPA: esterase-like activity of phytase family protein [Alphaproteobacteria bacterium]|nr:esterase-like activity of phytase family protein [Alphaproteobacteria bacterium]